MVRIWMLRILVVCCVVGQVSPASAQNILDVLLGQSPGSAPQLQIKTPEAKLLIQSKDRLKKVIASVDVLRKKHKERALRKK